MKKVLLSSAALVSAFSLSVPGSVKANTISITAEVVQECSISSASIDFGTYVSNQGDAVSTTGEISYTNCANLALRIAADGGASGDVNARQLSDGGSNVLNYQLYKDASLTQVWTSEGNDRIGTTPVPGSPSGSIEFYAQIPGGQTVPSGTYTDTINLTLTF